MAEELNIITSDVNTVEVNTEDRIVTITNDSDNTTVTLSAAETTIVQIGTIGPKGDKGDTGNIDSSTLANTGSNTFIGNQTITGSIRITNGITGSLLGTASFASTASYALNAGAGAGFPYSGSAVITGSLLVTGEITGSFSGSVIGYVPNEATTSFITNIQTGSFATTESLNSFTSSINNFTQSILTWTSSVITNTQTGSMLQPYVLSTQLNSYLTTGSSGNTQTISGSLTINQNLIVLGSQSIQYITSSQLDISTNIIRVSTSTPGVRFGGLAVYDSGSTGKTGSILWDSQNDVWIYTNPSGSDYDGAMFLTGPKNTGTTGNEVGITENYLAKGAGSHHMTSSQISDDGTKVTIPGNLVVSGSITGSFSGSVVGYVPNTATSSFITNNQTGSFITNSQTASFARTGSNSFNGNQTISGSTLISGSLTVTGSTNLFGTTGTTLLSSNADTLTITGSLIVTGSSVMSGSLNITNGVTASLQGTSSWATNAITASSADTLTVRGNLIVSGNTTIGDTTTDSITMTATTMSLGSGTGVLNIDSNTLYVDGNANRIGIGKIPTTTFEVSGSTLITGSLNVTNGITASLQGTASWATNATTAQTALNYSETDPVFSAAQSNLAIIGGSNTFTGNQIIVGNLTVNGVSDLDNTIISGALNINNPEGGVVFANNADQITFSGSLDMSGSLNLSGSLNIFENAWTPYTPTWTAETTQPSIGDGTLTGAYKQIGKTVFVRVRLVFGTTTDGGDGAWYFGLPVTASEPSAIQMPCSILDISQAWYQATVNGQYAGFTHKTALIGQSNGSNSSQGVAYNFPITFGESDSLQFNGSYEAL